MGSPPPLDRWQHLRLADTDISTRAAQIGLSGPCSDAAAAARIPDIRYYRSILHKMDDCTAEKTAIQCFVTEARFVWLATAAKRAKGGKQTFAAFAAFPLVSSKSGHPKVNLPSLTTVAD